MSQLYISYMEVENGREKAPYHCNYGYFLERDGSIHQL